MANLLRLRVIPNDTRRLLTEGAGKHRQDQEVPTAHTICHRADGYRHPATSLHRTRKDHSPHRRTSPYLRQGRQQPRSPPREDDVESERPPREGNPIGAEAGNEPPSQEDRLYASSSSPDSSDGSQGIERVNQPRTKLRSSAIRIA
jgi:hypothetical protein